MIKLKDDEILYVVPEITMPHFQESDSFLCGEVKGYWTEGILKIGIVFRIRPNYEFVRRNLEYLASDSNGMPQLISYLFDNQERFKTLTVDEFIEDFSDRMNEVCDRMF